MRGISTVGHHYTGLLLMVTLISLSYYLKVVLTSIRNSDGKTALDLAREKGCLEVVEFIKSKTSSTLSVEVASVGR
jgi:hypothetical protein